MSAKATVKGFDFITPALSLELMKPESVLGFSPINDILVGQQCF